MKLSIVIPIYNVEKFLERTLSSIVSQSGFDQVQLLLIDDGSKDTSSLICDKFSQTYENVQSFHIPNGGVSNARNEGLKHAVGDYVAFFDSDDQIPPGTIQKYLTAMLESPDVVVGAVQRIFVSDENKNDIVGPASDVFLREKKKDFFNDLNSVSERWLLDYIWNKCFKKSLLDRISAIFEKKISLGEDFYFNCYVFQYVQSLYLISSPCYIYFIRCGSLVSAFQKDALWLRNVMVERHKAFYASQNILTTSRIDKIDSYQGFLAFGALRGVNSPRCFLKKSEKNSYLKSFLCDSIFDKILFYLQHDNRRPQRMMFRLLRRKSWFGLQTCLWIDAFVRKVKGDK